MIVKLVFNNADATPKTTSVTLHADDVPNVMAWYGAFYAGDRYTVARDGRNVPPRFHSAFRKRLFLS